MTMYSSCLCYYPHRPSSEIIMCDYWMPYGERLGRTVSPCCCVWVMCAPHGSPPDGPATTRNNCCTLKEEKKKGTLTIKPRALDITWGADQRYWKFSSNDISSPVELLQVSWLQVNGKALLNHFDPEKEYSVKFKVELKPDNFGWAPDRPVYLMVAIDSQRSWKKADLSTKIAGKEFVLPIDKLLTFKVPQDTNSKMVEFGMYEIWKGTWKGGLVINEVVIEPV